MATTTATTTVKNISTNSFGFASPKLSSTQSTCNICKRLLYTFEEILVCRVCHGSYHWRCVKPETISHYGENAHFICDKCNNSISTTTSPAQRVTNGGIKIKSSETSETDYRDFVHIPSKISTTPTKDTNVVNAIRYFEEKQQQQQQPLPPQAHKISKQVEYDDNLSTQTNGQHTDDNKITRRLQQQQQQQQQQQPQNGIESDDENATSGAFQANYQYTPLKEYAAMRSGRTINDNNTNGYQKSPSADTDPLSSARYSSGLRYTTHGYDPTKSRIGESPLNHSTIDNRQQHYINSTNFNINGTSSYRQQQQQNDQRNPLNHSSPYLSQIHDDGLSTLKSLSQQQQQIDRHSVVGSDSGIVMVQQRPSVDENQLIEKKLTDLVQKLGRQLESDSQKLSEKLELKLKNLENMIHQQTYIIRRQDEVIERLKSKILKIETERDHFRDRLSIHEQREQDEKKTLTTTETEGSINTNDFLDRNVFEQDDQQQTFNDISTNRKFSNTSSVMTDHSKPSSKKAPAPRADHHASLHNNNQNESTVAKLIKSFPSNQDRLASASSAPSIATTLASSVPLVENPAAASRLDHIIHQSNTKEVNNLPPSSNYNVAQVRQFDRNQTVEPLLMEKQQIITSIHHDDIQIEETKPSDVKSKRSASYVSSSPSTSSASTSVRADTYDLTATNNVTLAARNSNLHRSLESIPHKTSEIDQGLKATNKTASLELGKKPVRYDDPASIYITPEEANHPASQYEDVIKGWLRKQNRERIERFYCVLMNNNLLMHRHENDTLPHKVINLRGAKVLYYDDQKFGPSLELTWTKRLNDPKHYHLYAPNPQEAHQWVTGIQTAIQNLENNNNKWQRYRMNT